MRTPAGEDLIVSCEKCDYAANLEKATSKIDTIEDLKTEGDGKPLEVHTPGMRLCRGSVGALRMPGNLHHSVRGRD